MALAHFYLAAIYLTAPPAAGTKPEVGYSQVRGPYTHARCVKEAAVINKKASPLGGVTLASSCFQAQPAKVAKAKRK